MGLNGNRSSPQFKNYPKKHDIEYTCEPYSLWINSVAPTRCGNDFKIVISEHMLLIKLMVTSCKMSLMWMSENLWRQVNICWGNGLVPATGHYQSQYRTRSMSVYGVTMPQCDTPLPCVTKLQAYGQAFDTVPILQSTDEHWSYLS